MDVKKRGNALGFWFFRTFVKLFGLSGAYALLYPVCLYYLIFDRAAISSCMPYVRRRFKTYNFFRRICAVYTLFINQGKSLIDRYCAVADPSQFDMELKGYKKIKNLLYNSHKGMILLTAHVGNWQISMTALARLKKTVYLLMSPEENAAVKDTLNIDDEKGKVRIISPDMFLGGIIEIMKVIDEGNIVSIMGDRSYGYNAVEVSFLGENISLPNSAFSIAAAIKCPVVILLSARVSRKKYIIDVSNIIEPRYTCRSKKKDETRAYVQEFARILEAYTDRYPFQWFVFRDLWGQKFSK
jgi:predicted LPLAT superfamily acyltransferase